MSIQDIIDEAGACGPEELREVGRLIRSSHSLAAAFRSLLGTATEWTNDLASRDFDSKADLKLAQGRIRGLLDGINGLVSDIEQAETARKEAEDEEDDMSDFNPATEN